MPRIRLFVAVAGDLVYVETPASLKSAGVQDADLAEGFGEAGRWWDVELNTPTFGLQEEAKRLAQVPDPMTGFRLDTGLLPKTRAQVMIAGWPDWRWPDFDSLPPNVANILDLEIQATMYPASTAHEGFMEALRRRLQPSQAGTSEQPKKDDSPA